MGSLSKLKDLRLKAGYSQKDVYEHFKIPQSTFSSWEIGKSEPSGEMLVRLCNFYKCVKKKRGDDMNNIGDILKRLREENNLTGKEAVEKLKELGIDISAKTLYGYESGRNSTNADTFLALCKIYNCQNIMNVFLDSTDEVLFTNKEWNVLEQYRSLDNMGKSHIDYELNREIKRIEELQKQSEYIKHLENAEHNDNKISDIDTRLINYYYRVASAGTGQIIFDMPPTKRIEIPNTPKYRKVDYAIGVNGNSMEPLYYDGDILLVEMTEEIEIGEVGIFQVDNESYVKKLGEKELISLNPASPNITLNETARCMGRVIDKLTNNCIGTI